MCVCLPVSACVRARACAVLCCAKCRAECGAVLCFVVLNDVLSVVLYFASVGPRISWAVV